MSDGASDYLKSTATCSACSGTGGRQRNQCKECNGAGRVSIRKPEPKSYEIGSGEPWPPTELTGSLCICLTGDTVHPRCPVHCSPINPNPPDAAAIERDADTVNDRLGAWLSAAMDDPNVCDAMKADITAWFDYTQPSEKRVQVSDTYFPGENRKAYPVFTGALMYFPNAFAALARLSHTANEQHNPGEPVHWDMTKSIGDGNEMLRHAMEAAGPNPVDMDGEHHDVKAMWRAAELVERRILRERGQ